MIPKNEEVLLFIPGVPQAKERPRFRVVNGRAMAYTPKKTNDYEQFVAECFRKAHPDYKTYTGPVKLTMRFVLPFPKSRRAYYHATDCPKLVGAAIPTPSLCLENTIYKPCRSCKPVGLAWYVPITPMVKPDLDNLEKSIMDGFQKSEVIEDDKQVIWKESLKEYGPEPGVVVSVRYGVEF